MCIVLLWRNLNAKSKYKFVLAANRDEAFYRPAKPASFWEDIGHSSVLAGRDMAVGFEGGSWLGITRSGKVCFLTNIHTANNQGENMKQGRGQLVSNYLTSPLNGKNYLESLHDEKGSYRMFNLFAGDVTNNCFCTSNYPNESVVEIKNEYFCLSNVSLQSEPTLKIENSLKKFKDVCGSGDIHDQLLELLTDTELNTTNRDDPLSFTSTIFLEEILDGPFATYGTRTNTVITVSNDDRVTFIERTKTRLGQPPEEWRKSVFEFDILL